MTTPREVTAHRLKLPGGAPYMAKVPEPWDGTLVLYSQGPLVKDDDPFWVDNPITDGLLARGHAVAGWASSRFWHLEEAFTNQVEVLEHFATAIGRPERVIAYGQSIGGLITAGLVQVCPELLQGALSTCGPLAGGVATFNRELDIAFVVKTLIAAHTDLQVIGIDDLDRNQELAKALLEEAAATPSGRARLALSAAIANVSDWSDPTSAAPDRGDLISRFDNQLWWYRNIVFGVVFAGRAVVEDRAGGNPSQNLDVNYGDLLERSVSLDVARAMYEQSDIKLADDLDRLEQEPRIEADASAVEYLERHIVFNGQLSEVPVLTVHSIGDGLCTPDHERAYGEVVGFAGSSEHLRQLYVQRAAHCVFAMEEVLTAFDALDQRIISGSWGELEPASLNDAARRLGTAGRRAVDAYGPTDSKLDTPAFCEFVPWKFPRSYDARLAH